MVSGLWKYRSRERAETDEDWIETTEILQIKIRFLKVKIGIWASKCTLEVPGSRKSATLRSPNSYFYFLESIISMLKNFSKGILSV